MTLKVGDAVEGRYKILKALDQGGMGDVFLAEHQLIKRRVALKLLRADLAEDADVLERFMNEAQAAGTLGHPNIVESTDMGFTRDGVPYIVFEFLEGSLLTDEIYRVRGLATRRALRIARQIASALHAAHSAGIVHRDLKSDNVFLTDRDGALDHVKVLDFGISRFLEADDNVRNRAMVIGTPQFMAPEQITHPETVDRRADIYALGVILYEMLACRRPFENAADPEALFQQIISEPPPPLGVADLPPGLETMIVERFLAKDPDARFATMQDAEAALSAFAGIIRPPGRDSAPIPLAIPPPEAAVAVALPPPPPPRQRTSIAWLVTAIVAAAAGAALLVVDPKTTADPNIALVQGDADKLTAAIESATHAAQLRVNGLAQTPMLRAGVETDVATVTDMFKSEFSLQLSPGDAFALLQKHDGQLATMLRVPANIGLAVRPDHQPRLQVATSGLEVVVSSPVTGRNGTEIGAVALGIPIDLGPLKHQLGTHAIAAELHGLTAPVVLVAPHGTGTPTTIALAFPKELGVTATLAATVPVVVAPNRTVARVRLACWALAGILAFGYFLNLLRTRRPG
ncbi:MAG: serine/threonine-protein kinase [Kofleriaceae bacterium]